MRLSLLRISTASGLADRYLQAPISPAPPAPGCWLDLQRHLNNWILTKPRYSILISKILMLHGQEMHMPIPLD